MTDVSTQESNTNNNDIPADSFSLQIQPIANLLSSAKNISRFEWKTHPDLVTNILLQKGFVYTAMYDDESDEKESDRDAGAHQTSNRDIGAWQTENMAADVQKRDINTPQSFRSSPNDSDSINNKSFDNVNRLLQHTSNNTRKRKHSVTSHTPQRDRTPLQMSQEILHQFGDEMVMNVNGSPKI